MSIAPPKLITADELFEMGDIGPCELVRGEIVTMAPAGFEHGDVASEINFQIRLFVRRNKLGKVLAAETGFLLRRNPDTVRAADVAFVRKTRVPSGERVGFLEVAPDLVVEVISPSDRMTEVHAKAQDWISAGTQSVWIVDPPNETIDVHRDDGTVTRHRSPGILDNEPSLPGFTLNLAEVFDAD